MTQATSDIEEPPTILERGMVIAPEVKADVKRSHINLGHCGRNVLLRCLRASKASPEHIAWAERFVCRLCRDRAAPMTIKPAAVPKMPRRFNHTVGIDLRQEYDSNSKSYVTIGIICYATNFSAYELLESKDPRKAAEAFFVVWVKWAGVPEVCVHDLGGEFQGEMTALAERWAVQMRVGPTEAPWQQAKVERHGQVLGEETSSGSAFWSRASSASTRCAWSATTRRCARTAGSTPADSRRGSAPSECRIDCQAQHWIPSSRRRTWPETSRR